MNREQAHLDAATYTLSGVIYGGGAALADSGVEALADGSNTVVAATTADTSGHYALALPAGTYDLRVSPPPASGFAGETAQNIVIGTAAVTHDVILLSSEGSRLRGTITGYGGAAVESAQLNVYSASGQYIGSVATDATGSYAINLADGSYQLVVYPPNTSVTPMSSQVQAYSVEVSGNTTRDFPLPVVAITGVVTDSNGAPVPGTSVSVTTGAGDSAGYAWSSGNATTGDDGRYHLLVLAGGASFELRPPATAHLAPMFVSGVTVSADGPFDFTLGSQSSVLAGKITGYGGAAVESAQLNVYSASGQYIGSVATDATGSYAINLADGSYQLVVYPPNTGVTPMNSQVQAYSVEVSGNTTRDFPLPVVAITGVVTDSNGAPVPGTGVSVTTGAGDSAGYAWSSGNATTGDDGRYHLLVLAGGASFELRPPAAAHLAPMFVSGVTVSADGPFDFTLGSQSSVLAGKITGYGGAVVESAQLNVYSASGQYIGSVATDATGSYAINLADGSYQLVVYPPNTSVTPMSSQVQAYSVEVSGNTTRDFPLPVVAITGVVTDSNGAPVPGTSVSVTTGAGDSAGYAWSTGNATTGDDGRYRLLVLAGGASFELRPPVSSGFAPAFLSGVSLTSDLGQSVILALVDRTPPSIVAGPTVVHLSDTSVSIRWTTNEAATSHLEYGIGGLTQVRDQSALSVSHDMTLVGLEPSSIYSYRVSSVDAQGNGPTESAVFTFRTQDPPGDITAPVIVSGPIVSFTSDTSAILEWQTDEPASSRVEFGVTSALGSSALDPSGNFLVDHSVTLTALVPETVYFARVVSSDPDGNGPTVSDLVTFRASSTPDTTAPELTAGPSIVSVTDHSITIEWTTNEPATSGVSFNDGTRFGLVNDDRLVTDHSVTLSDLSPATLYSLTVSSKDLVGNGPVLGGPVEATTSAAADTTAPTLSNLVVTNVTESTAVVTWTTNEPATSRVNFGTNASSPDGVVADLALVLEHQVLLTGLGAATTYYLKASSSDVSGNTASSAAVSFTTQSSQPAKDRDRDGVPDSSDACPSTLRLAKVNASGCSVSDLCPCKQPRGVPAWRNHGAYVTCVESTVRSFVSTGILDKRRGKAVVAAAKCSTCGSSR